MRILELPALIVFIGVAVSGCSSAPVASPPASAAATVSPATVAGVVPAAAQPVPAVATSSIAPAPVAAVRLAPHLDPQSPISANRSVYFDFEEYSIRGDHAGLLERHGRYLASQPALAIRIEGNADEIGGSEYNLALGQKRAEAVLRALKLYGVRDSQMEAVSWGEEHPKAPGHGEAAWAQNRRADLAYPSR